MKTLGELFRSLPEATLVSGSWDVPVRGIVYDSRRVEPGFLFVCIEGFHVDGHLYAEEALKNGACCLVVQRPLPLPPETTCVQVADTRSALAVLAANYYDHPSRWLRMIGVTGTNGKTTTAYLIESILKASGKHPGLLGTISNRLDQENFETNHTTPEAVELQELLACMRKRCADYVVMEVSSHALALERVKECAFDVAVFTNLTQDHLDFHGDLGHYLRSKARLFAGLEQGSQKEPKYAVINIDDPHHSALKEVTNVPVVYYGRDVRADVRATNVRVAASGAAFQVCYPGGSFQLNLKLTGLFSVYNALAACAVGLQENLEPGVICQALESLEGVPGRFERVDEGQDFTVVVDYAHTPDGLENVLVTAREITSNRLITVFGCGGDRDRSKRPLMGEVAARHSDLVIITSDNPRSEDPLKIISEIEPGVQKAGRANYYVQPFRYRAIEAGIALACPGDVVLIAGKGHEDYQIIGDKVLSFDDRLVARQILKGASVPVKE